MTTFEKLRRVAAAQAIDAAERSSESLDIFLAGPFVMVDQPPDHPTNASTPAALLRHHLYRELNAKGHEIYLGEDDALRSTGNAHYGSLNNAVLYERHYIKKHCDAVIILPSSPGSFCEVGDWASAKDICQYMLLIADSVYEGVVNYINEGVISFARSNNATIHYHDYSDHSGVLSLCNNFLDMIAARSRIDKLYDRA